MNAMLNYAYAVTYPTEYKRFRVAFPRSGLGGAHAAIRTDEGLAMAPPPQSGPMAAPEST
jgi:hypothetical protein